MQPWIRRSALAAAALVLLAGAVFVGAAQLGERKRQRTIALAGIAPVPYADDAASIARGRYLFASRGCGGCHGADGAGGDVISDGKGFLVHAPNITPVPGDVVAGYREVDWVRAIRHGVKPDGRPLLIMPCEEFNRFTDADLAALVAYVRHLPAVQAPGATVQLPMLVKALYGAGLVRDAAEKIDHTKPPQPPVPEAATAAHGAYVANACIGCHGASLSGGRIAGAPPDWPAAANLTPGAGSVMGRYAEAGAFARMLRSGQRPDGSAVSPVMPFAVLKEFSDTDVQALWLHLKALPPKATGEGR
jgi:mono/diheme cytochrome c family protein